MQGALNGGELAGGIIGGVVGLVLAIGGYLVWRQSRRRQLRGVTGFSRREHNVASQFVATRLPRLMGNGRHGPLSDVAAHPPLMSGHRLPSFPMSDPRTPAPSYMPRRQTRGQDEESLEDVSIIGSDFSTPSDVTAMGMLMPTSPSTYLPSYATSLSTPPSYTTEAAGCGGSRSPSEKQSYASSS